MKSINTEIRALSLEQLEDRLTTQRSELNIMLFNHATQPLDNTSEIAKLRRNVARLNTELRSRQLAAFNEEQLANRSKIRARRRRG